MDNVLDLLYEYSKQGKIVDKRYIKEVIKILIKEEGIEDYIKGVNFSKMSTNHINLGIPIMNNLQKHQMEVSMINMRDMYYMLEIFAEAEKLEDFQKTFFCNLMLLHIILQAIEYSIQVKEMDYESNFKQMLLQICLCDYMKFLEEGSLSKFLINNFQIYLNPELYRITSRLKELNQQYGNEVPLVRLANINSGIKLQRLLERINGLKDIKNVIKIFDHFMNGMYANGYILKDGIVSAPTERYLSSVKNLHILEINSKLNGKFKGTLQLAKNSPFENRLLLGLSITEEEYQKILVR